MKKEAPRGGLQRSLCLTSVLLAPAVGCGDGTSGPGTIADAKDLEGAYSVQMHTVGSGCDGTEDRSDVEEFRLIGSELLGMQQLAFEECPTAGDCHSNFFEDFAVIRQQWAMEIAHGNHDGTTCKLEYTWGTLDADVEAGEVTIEIRRYAESDSSLAEADCSDTVAEKRGEGMACSGYEMFVGKMSGS